MKASLPLILMMPLAIWGMCNPPYVLVVNTCYYYERDITLTYEEANEYCNEMGGGTLATIDDTRLFASMIDYMYGEGLNTTSYWVDGTDKKIEGKWVSSSGKDVSMGTPFWAGYFDHQEPRGWSDENCLLLDKDAAHYLNDEVCSERNGAICETGYYYRTLSHSQSTRNTVCPMHYAEFYQTCLSFVTWTNTSWEESRLICEERQGRLAIIDNIVVWRQIYLYLQEKELSQYDFWLGGSDEAEEGVWLWLDGSPVPMGTPYWGLTNDIVALNQEPNGGTRQNYLAILGYAYGYFRDIEGHAQYHPLCEWIDG